MTVTGFLFLAMGILITGIISFRRMLGSRILPWALFAYHLIFAFYYWFFTLNRGGDALIYYKKAARGIAEFGTGTQFIDWLMSRLYSIFAGDYLDYYVLFQLFGFLGFCLLHSILDEVVFFQKTPRARNFRLAILFFPNMHFWSSAIGKDSLIFFAVLLVTWGMIRYQKRLLAIVAGFFLMYFIRPHIAGIFLGAIFMALLWGPGIPLRWRITGNLLVVIAIVLLLPQIQKFVGLEEVSVQSVGQYLEKRQGLNLEGGSSVDIRQYSLPLKIFTFFYRPLFFDARNINGFVISMENVFYLWFLSFLFSGNFLRVLWKYRFSFFMRFNFIAFITGTFILALSVSNTGIAVRQKNMFLPGFLILVVTLFAIREYYAAAMTPARADPGVGGTPAASGALQVTAKGRDA